MSVRTLQLANFAFLALLIIGLPAALSLEIVTLRLTAGDLLSEVVLGACVLGFVANVGISLQARCLRPTAGFWCWLYGFVGLTQFWVLSHRIGFDWLRRLLRLLAKLFENF